MTTDRDDLDLIFDNISELVRPKMLTQTVKAYVSGEWRSKHRQIEIPSLIDQLQAAFVSSSGDAQSGSGFGSRPNARIDAMDTIMRIDTEAGNWVDRMGHTIQPDLRDNLRWLNDQAARLTDAQQLHWLALDVRGWGTCARVVSGWEVPPFRPDNTCPLCAKRGGLRIRFGDQQAQGMCIHCGEYWTASTIGLLGEHIASESEGPGREFVELGPLDVDCLFCQAPAGMSCRSCLLREETTPHETRASMAAAGTFRVAS